MYLISHFVCIHTYSITWDFCIKFLNPKDWRKRFWSSIFLQFLFSILAFLLKCQSGKSWFLCFIQRIHEPLIVFEWYGLNVRSSIIGPYFLYYFLSQIHDFLPLNIKNCSTNYKITKKVVNILTLLHYHAENLIMCTIEKSTLLFVNWIFKTKLKLHILNGSVKENINL